MSEKCFPGEAQLNEYAQLAIHQGVHIQRGDVLRICANVENVDFVRRLVSAAYDAGATNVIVDWNDEFITHVKYKKAPDSEFTSFPSYQKALEDECLARKVLRISIHSANPDLLSDINPARIGAYQKIAMEATKEAHSIYFNNEVPWCVISVPNKAWAKKIFPNLDEDSAVCALWKAIFEASHFIREGKALLSWQEHVRQLSGWVRSLNEYHFKSLHYTNSLGTDFTVELPLKHKWLLGCEEKCRDGRAFSANIPSEEVFTAPHKYNSHGVLYASKPLCMNGNIIEGIRFEVENGRIVKANADRGEEILRAQLAVDEGASYFGEVALVPYDSPISAQNILYYNTLFDENASCHIAFGRAYATCLEGGEALTPEELDRAGINDSCTHIDFMLGTKDLSIVGLTYDGREIPVFANGNYSDSL